MHDAAVFGPRESADVTERAARLTRLRDNEKMLSAVVAHMPVVAYQREMDADWTQMRTAAAPANDALYKNLIYGTQLTGGSNSIRNSWIQMRTAGASARAMPI